MKYIDYTASVVILMFGAYCWLAPNNKDAASPVILFIVAVLGVATGWVIFRSLSQRSTARSILSVCALATLVAPLMLLSNPRNDEVVFALRISAIAGFISGVRIKVPTLVLIIATALCLFTMCAFASTEPVTYAVSTDLVGVALIALYLWYCIKRDEIWESNQSDQD
jgi:branched-subunit amino acid ABC-type transport system permease component